MFTSFLSEGSASNSSDSSTAFGSSSISIFLCIFTEKSYLDGALDLPENMDTSTDLSLAIIAASKS